MTEPAALPPPARPTPRLRSLDGLRGLAALVVVVHHCLLLFPSMAGAYLPADPAPPQGPAGWLMTYSPLHVLWAGTESVYLFFVLSGIVLVLPVLSRPDFSWLAYYPRRLIRLYGPVLAAVALGLLNYAVAPRYNDPAFGPWVNRRSNTYPPDAVLSDAILLTGQSGRVSPLWSLEWEVLFSLLLPVYVLLLVRGRRFDAVKAVLLLAVLVVASVVNLIGLYYLSMFAVGALTAVRWRTIEGWVKSWSARWRPFWPVVAGLGVVLTVNRWELLGLGVSAVAADDYAFLAVIGVWLLVLTAWFCPRVSRFLHAPAWQAAGRISFSLYLVHEPIVLSCRFLTAPAPPWVAILVAVPTALVVAVLFERLVESRFHRLAQRVGRALQPRTPVPARV